MLQKEMAEHWILSHYIIEKTHLILNRLPLG